MGKRKADQSVSPIFSNDKVNVESRFSSHLLGCHGQLGATSSKMADQIRGHPTWPTRYELTPNHCGRHLGKINGHKPIYVLTWRCIQYQFYVISMQPCLNKLLQSQAEVCVMVVNA